MKAGLKSKKKSNTQRNRFAQDLSPRTHTAAGWHLDAHGSEPINAQLISKIETHLWLKGKGENYYFRVKGLMKETVNVSFQRKKKSNTYKNWNSQDRGPRTLTMYGWHLDAHGISTHKCPINSINWNPLVTKKEKG